MKKIEVSQCLVSFVFLTCSHLCIAQTGSDSGSKDTRDIEAAIRTNEIANAPIEVQVADAWIRQGDLQQQLSDGKINRDTFANSVRLIANDLSSAGAVPEASKMFFHVTDAAGVSPQIRANAWFDFGKLLLKSGGHKDVAVASVSATDAFDSAVKCLEENPKDKRTENDLLLEGSCRTWLASACEIAGERERGLQERLKLLADSELVSKTYPEAVLGSYLKIASYFDDRELIEDAEKWRIEGVRFLLANDSKVSDELRMSTILGLASNSPGITTDLRLALLERLWKSDSLRKKPQILAVGNDLGLYYYFDEPSKTKRAPFFKEMLSRCELIIGEMKKNKISDEEIAHCRMIMLQMLALQSELERLKPETERPRFRNDENRAKIQRIAQDIKVLTLIVPVNHPNCDQNQLSSIINYWVKKTDHKSILTE